MIRISVDPSEAVNKLHSAAARIVLAIEAGFAEGLEDAASEMVTIATAAGVPKRTGTLLGSIMGHVDDSRVSGWIGVDEGSVSKRGEKSGGATAGQYAYLLTNQVKNIVPKGDKPLTFPAGVNFTGAGVPRFYTVAALIDEFGDDVVFGKRFIGVKVGKRKPRIEIYFAKSWGVSVHGYGVMEPAAKAAGPIIRDRIVGAIREAMKE